MAFADWHLFFDDVEIGQEFSSPGRTVTQADIVNFAGLSGDFNPIHMDHAYAATTPFRQPIAHGLLVFSIGSGLGVNSPAMRTIAFMKVREWNFIAPVFIGDTIRMQSKVLEKHLRGRGKRGEVVWSRRIINQDGRTVQDGVLVTMVECKPIPKADKSILTESPRKDEESPAEGKEILAKQADLHTVSS